MCDQLELEISQLIDESQRLRQQKKDFTNKQTELEMKRRTLRQMSEPSYNVNTKKKEIKINKILTNF